MQQDHFEYSLQEAVRVYHLSHNQKIRDFHQNLYVYSQQLAQEMNLVEFGLVIASYIQNFHSHVHLETYNFQLSEYARKILSYYDQNDDQHQHILNYFNRIEDFRAEHAGNEKRNRYYSSGFEWLKKEIESIDKFRGIAKFYQNPTLNLPTALQDLISELTESYYALKGFDYEQAKQYKNLKIDQICQDYPLEIINLAMFALNHHDHLNRIIDDLFDELMSKKDKRLNQPEILFKLAHHFEDFIKISWDFHYFSKKPLIQHLIFSLEKLAKEQKLNHEIIEAFEKINVTRFLTCGITTKRLEQIQNKIDAIIADFKQQQNLQETGQDHNQFIFDHYQLPFSNLSASVSIFTMGGNRRSIHWANELQTEFEALQGQEKADWLVLWQHIDSTTAKKPTQKWLKEAEKIFNTSVKNSYQDNLVRWVELMMKQSPKDTRPFDSKNENTIKGLLWFGLFLQTQQKEFLELVTRFAQFCYRKIYGVGAASAVIGNICLFVLSKKGFDGLGKLSFLQKKIRYELGQKVIRQALTEAAQENNLTTEQIKDVVCEDFEFEQGKLAQATQWSDYDLVLQCMGDKRCDVAIYETQTQQCVEKDPKGFKTASVVKDLKKQAKLVADVLNVESSRLEDAMNTQRQWSYEFWQTYILNHGLLGWLAQKLIWQLQLPDQKINAIYHQEQWVNAQGEVLDIIPEHITALSLWHPIHSTAEEVKAWRVFLTEREILQSFKQAFREVYVVTPAEINAEKKSLRFAYHYLKQSQFKAIANGRKWSYDIQGGWDGHNTPTRYFAKENIRAFLSIETPHGSELVSSTGVYLYIKTQKISFMDNHRDLNLVEIPKIVFSETMRDVDYFIQGCSIGLDLNLELSGFPDEMRQYYDHTYRQLSKSQVIQTRHDTLDLIVSKLPIAKQCRLDEQFIYVDGKIGQYKIHLGTGHIWMLPNDQYLCIVPEKTLEKAERSQLFLPFEDDAMLSLILSKVLLLSQDDQIQDELITRQIQAA